MPKGILVEPGNDPLEVVSNGGNKFGGFGFEFDGSWFGIIFGAICLTIFGLWWLWGNVIAKPTTPTATTATANPRLSPTPAVVDNPAFATLRAVDSGTAHVPATPLMQTILATNTPTVTATPTKHELPTVGATGVLFQTQPPTMTARGTQLTAAPYPTTRAPVVIITQIVNKDVTRIVYATQIVNKEVTRVVSIYATQIVNKEVTRVVTEPVYVIQIVTATPTETPTPTATVAGTATQTPTPTLTNTPLLCSAIPGCGATNTPTNTATKTATPTTTATVATATLTPTVAATVAVTATKTITNTATAAATVAPTATLTPTATATP